MTVVAAVADRRGALRSRRIVLLVAAVAAGLLAAYIAAWAGLGTVDQRGSDFVPTYIAGRMLRAGDAGQLYDASAQAPLQAQVVPHGYHVDLPFLDPPAAALLAAPFSWLDAGAAYRTWGAVQLLLLLGAVAVAARAAPWPARAPMSLRATTALAALAGTATIVLLLQAQWDGLLALGLAMAYRSWRRGEAAAGGAWLAACAAVAKPHLALGLAAWLLFRRDRRALAGACGAVAAVAAVSLAVAGPSGMAGWAAALRDSTSHSPLPTMLGWSGLFGSWLGDVPLAHALGWAGTVLTVAACALLGRRSRGGEAALEWSLAAATTLSLLAAPHLLLHDLVVLAPALVWCAARAAAADAPTPWPGPLSARVLAVWATFNLLALLDLGRNDAGPPGRLVPWALLLAALAAVQPLRTAGAAALRPRRTDASPC